MRHFWVAVPAGAARGRLDGALVASNRALGACPDGLSAGTRWPRPRAVPREVHPRALEALDAAGAGRDA